MSDQRPDPVSTGLKDGFVEYATPSEDEYRHVLKSGLVVVDTNVLLNLYRYHSAAREDLFRILQALGERLFVPNQVASEFWRNRESTIRASTQQTAQLRGELEAHRSRSLQSIATWAGRVALSPESSEDLTGSLAQAYEEVFSRIDVLNSQSLSLEALDTNFDPILRRLTVLLAGRVGPPLPATDLEAARQESERRIADQEPPGYADSAKSGDWRHGDYFIWRQLLTEASDRGLDVLLVTGDIKEDWWRREAGETRGPRLELGRELATIAGVRLFMLRPANLFARAADALDLTIDAESVRAAETVDRLATRLHAEERRHPIEKLPDGRGGGYLETLIEMTSLAEGSPSIDEYLDLFQDRFPTISLRDVARRRTRSLESLDLAEIRDGEVSLTSLGQRLLDERSLELVQETFLRRIAGAPEIRDLAASTPLTALRTDLRGDAPAGLSPTQASLVLRWLEQLDLA